MFLSPTSGTLNNNGVHYRVVKKKAATLQERTLLQLNIAAAKGHMDKPKGYWNRTVWFIGAELCLDFGKHCLSA